MCFGNIQIRIFLAVCVKIQSVRRAQVFNQNIFQFKIAVVVFVFQNTYPSGLSLANQHSAFSVK